MSDPVASLSASVRKLNRLDGFVSERASGLKTETRDWTEESRSACCAQCSPQDQDRWDPLRRVYPLETVPFLVTPPALERYDSVFIGTPVWRQVDPANIEASLLGATR